MRSSRESAPAPATERVGAALASSCARPDAKGGRVDPSGLWIWRRSRTLWSLMSTHDRSHHRTHDRGPDHSRDETTLRIRAAAFSDVPVLCDIAWAAKAHWPYPPEWLESWRAALSLTAPDLERWRVRVAELRALGVVGFSAASTGAPSWVVEHLWVLPASHGLGVGRALLLDVLAAARMSGATVVELDADPHAEPFYLRMGGTRVTTIPAPMPGDPGRQLPRIHFDVRAG